MGQNEVQKLIWAQVILVITMLLVVVGLFGFSIISFFQTYSSFEPLNDSSMMLFDFNIGYFIALFLSLIIQYGQNLALYVNKYFCKKEVLFKIGDIKIIDSNVAVGVFIITAVVDAFTNIVWYSTTVDVQGSLAIKIIINCIGYGSMILVVFVEEVLGIALDALSKAWKQLISLQDYDKRINNRENRNSGNMNNRPMGKNENRNSIHTQTPSYVNQGRQNIPSYQNRQTQGFQKPSYSPTYSQSKLPSNYYEKDSMPTMFEKDEEDEE